MEDIEEVMRHCRHGGPEEVEQREPWFVSGTLFLQTSTPSLQGLGGNSTAGEIWTALQETEQTLLRNSIFEDARTSTKCPRLFASLAVDAYINQDMKSVQNFLIKALLIDFLQNQIPIGGSLSSSGQKQKEQFVQCVQSILQGRDIEERLMDETKNSCHCVTMAKTMHEEMEDRSTHEERLKREAEHLPPILKNGSQLFKLKQKAASHLKCRRNKQSLDLYKQAEKLLDKVIEQEQKRGSPALPNVRKFSEEKARISCNISLLYMNLNDPNQALVNAEAGAASFPGWTKPHSRRAIALEELERLEEAESAIYKAIDEIERDVGIELGAEKLKSEYLGIQERIRRKLATREEASNNENDGIISERHENERMRRRVLVAPLGIIESMEIQQCLEDYCNNNLDDPIGALKDLLRSSLPHLPTSSWEELDEMLDDASVPIRKVIETVCVQEGPKWLRQHIQYRTLRRVETMINTDLDRDDLKEIYHRDIDGDAMRIALWFGWNEHNEEYRDGGQMAKIFLNNLIVSKAQREQAKLQQLGIADPILQQVQKLATLYNSCLPSRLWPCEKELESTWEYTARDVDRFWEGYNKQMFRRWRSAILNLIRWVEEVDEYDERIIVIMQGLGFKECMRGRLPLNVYSVGIFLLKTCAEYGSVDSLRSRLNNQRDYSELIADCYSHLRLFKAASPKIMESINVAKAQRRI